MKVAFHLRRLPAAEPANAFLLPSFEAGPLLDLCARIGSDPWPEVYAVADGFLLRVPQPATAAYAGTLRLRGLADNLFVPADAELVPSLHVDEARGLVRDRGLVFLPGGRVLVFAPREPLPLTHFLRAGPLQRRVWQSLPEPRPLPERIRQIVLEVPEPPADDLLDAGAEDIGTEDPRPEDSSLPSKILGQGEILAGKGMMGLGKLFNSKKLKDAGANLIKKGLSLAPRLSEALLGRQEAALRALLREFREGRLERALRRALPLGGAGDRGGVVSGGFRLPFNNLLYSLRSILGRRDGPAHLWLGGRDVQEELAAEYRKAAAQAAAAGDYRRAAYIYGRLLCNYRSAANMLQQGGLCHDAAILYLEKVGDPQAAARAFEAAGEIERAVDLYRQSGQRLLAGDLLRRAGEEEEALAEYRLVADQMTAAGDYLAAGELFLSRAARADLARECFAAGWSRRPTRNDIPCVLRLATLYAEQGSVKELLVLVGEAEAFLAPPGNDVAAGQIFNEVARLAEGATLTTVRDDLRDRALLGLAGKLRQRVAVEQRPGNLAAEQLGQPGTWEAPVVSDATFAVRAATRMPRGLTTTAAGGTVARVQVGQGLVRAVCAASREESVFLGFESGEIYCFRPEEGKTIPVSGLRGFPVRSLAVAADGQMVVACRPHWLASYVPGPGGGFRREGKIDYCDREKGLGLSPLILEIAHGLYTATWHRDLLHVRCGPLLVPVEEIAISEQVPDTACALLLPSRRTGATLRVLFFSGDRVISYESFQDAASGAVRLRPCWHAGVSLGWTPEVPEGSPLGDTPISCRWHERDQLELLALAAGGTLHWSLLQFAGDGVRAVGHNVAVRAEGYLAACLIRGGLVAGVSRSHIDWLRTGGKDFARWNTTSVSLPNAVACFPSGRTRELLVVCRDGVLARVPVPN